MRDTSRDGFGNKLQTFVLTHFKPFWRLCERITPLRRWLNKTVINSAINRIPPRPNPFSNLSPFTSWESLTNRTWSGRHLHQDHEFNKDTSEGGKLPPLDLSSFPPDPAKNPLAALFKMRGETSIEAEKSTLLFPYWVQWFTDSFLRTDHDQRLKNTSNHHIDLCNVYGLNRNATDKLRSHMGGQLKSQIINGEEYPLFYYQDPEAGKVWPEFEGLYTPLRAEQAQSPALKKNMFAMGVERANVQIGYVMLNVLWFREHNRICRILEQEYADEWRKEFQTLPKKTPLDSWQFMHPDWKEPTEQWKVSNPEWREDVEKYLDERIFQTARNIMIILIVKIVVEEYINHIAPYHFHFIVDPPSLKNPKWYRENWMPQEFSLVYRWHSALPGKFMHNGEQIDMRQSLWNNQMVIDKGLGELFEEASSQPASRIGLFNTPDFLLPVELMSIALCREAQLPSYNDYRELAGFPRVTDFNQISSDEETQTKLKELYGEVDNIEFYVGLFAEDVRPNSALPALIGRMVGIDAFSQAFTNPLLAPLVYNQRTFTPVGSEIIQHTCTLSQIVNRNVPDKGRTYKVTFDR